MLNYRRATRKTSSTPMRAPTLRRATRKTLFPANARDPEREREGLTFCLFLANLIGSLKLGFGFLNS